MKHRWLLFLILSVPLFAQQRYLVTSKDEIIPLRKGESVKEVLHNRHLQRSVSPTSNVCGPTFFSVPDPFPAIANYGAFHKDVMAEWFVMPATGTIDTLWWEVLGSVGAMDSIILLSVHRSRIGPNYGPGANGSNPFRAPCQSWGYYHNTNDCDRGITPFIDEATDTHWVSTIGANALGGAQTLPPTIGEALWGGISGFQHINQSSTVNFQAMTAYDTLKVTHGDILFISMSVKGPPCHTLDERTEFAVSGFRTTLENEYYPSRNWKFYEHDSGPSNCTGTGQPVSKGWVARGGFGDDSLDVAEYNWWFTMTVTSNVPPDVRSATVLHNTFNTGPFPIEAYIDDCDPSDPSRAGAESAVIRWSLNNVSQPDITMSLGGLDTWQGTIPVQLVGSRITYNITAADSAGLTKSNFPCTYRILQLGSAFYAAETSSFCTTHDISSTGTAISSAEFFLPPTSPFSHVRTDDGTAGPFDIGGDMMLFGGDYRYAWIGINGAIALSRDATDTIDVNANGAFSVTWTFPYADTLRTGRDASAATMARMPSNLIALSWNDLFIGDTLGGQLGHILYQQLTGTDSCLFVVQWDSVGAFTTGSTGPLDESKYRVVLNRCDGTIEFQYDNIGVLGLDSTALVGMQGQTNNEYVFVNQSGYPVEGRPRNDWCIKFYPGSTIVTIDTWNMVSLGVHPLHGDYSKDFNYPTAQGPLFSYLGSYINPGPLSNGLGYWAKFNGPGEAVGGRGTLLNSLNIPVYNGWNMVGSIGHPVATSEIAVTGGTVVSSYFGYDLEGYSVPTAIIPGSGYWVKMNGNGTLSLNYVGAASKQSSGTDLTVLNEITIVDAAGRRQSLYVGKESSVREPLSFFELPPAAPGFDIRYASGRMVETYPARIQKNGVYEYPIAINEATYPLTVRWDIKKAAPTSLILTSPNGKLGATVMNGSGTVKITDAGLKTLILKLADIKMPTKYALGQNYPNPFNPATRFEVAIPKTAYVTVAIFDVLGRHINTLMSGQQGAGFYTMEWDGRDARGLNVPTGIYFIRMLSDEFNQTQKIMLMK